MHNLEGETHTLKTHTDSTKETHNTEADTQGDRNTHGERDTVGDTQIETL